MKIVILPGLDGTGQLLSEVRDVLAQRHPVSILDYPVTLHRYLDIQHWVKARLPDEDFILIAESFAGPLAVLLASEGLPALRGVVFVATFARPPARVPAFVADLLRILPIGSGWLVALAQPLVMGRWSRPAFTETFRQALRLVPKATLAGRLKAVLEIDVRQPLQHRALPSIYLLPTRDRLVSAKLVKDFNLSPDHVFPVEGPHFLLQARPKECAAITCAFAARLAGLYSDEVSGLFEGK
ncbi:alpha/beta fold hydrolase [Oryzifoliimicrobium ureilyticus]|uniref:alpha/beta fold hydrolase n=1 Tax=Oryzifoliimicrobium ureilyticus TaxID=3113724 RepID=UPI0030767F83